MEYVPGFAKMPRSLLRDRNIPSSYKAVWSAIADRARNPPARWPGVETLARWAGVSRTTARRAIEALAAAGLLRVSGGGNGVPAAYHVPDPDDPTGGNGGCWTCPIAARYLAAGGQVTCPIPAGYLASYGPSMFIEKDREGREKGPESFLSASAVKIGEEVKRKTGLHLSAKQLRHLEPAFRAGVPVEVALKLVPTWRMGEAPWDFAARLVKSFHQVAADVQSLVRYRELGMRPELPRERIHQVKTLGTAEQIAEAFGDTQKGG